MLFKTYIMCSVILGLVNCLPRDVRSVTPVEITFFPGLTEGSKDAVVFEQWRRFLEEEEAELAREESVALKLIQQDKSSLIEPIEYATQKRLLHQFKGSKKHRQDIYNNEQGLSNVIGNVEEERRHLEYIHNIQEPFEIVLIEPEQIKNTAYSIGPVQFQRKPETKTESTNNPLSSLQLPSIPNETVYRLLSDSQGTTHKSRPSIVAFPAADHITVDRITSTNNDNSAAVPPSSNHEEEKNKRIQEILKNQQQILEKDLDFLLDDERGTTEGPTVVTHTTNNNPFIIEETSVTVSTNQDTSASETANKWTNEEQIDWEETHEYDA